MSCRHFAFFISHFSFPPLILYPLSPSPAPATLTVVPLTPVVPLAAVVPDLLNVPGVSHGHGFVARDESTGR